MPLSELDQYLIGEGRNLRLWQALGAHVSKSGVDFAVWAPNAKAVSVVGDFNKWNGASNRLQPSGNTGVWEGSVAGIGEGAVYKFQIETGSGQTVMKADPVGFGSEHPPATASVVRDISRFNWNDGIWMHDRGKCNDIAAPISVYEVHLGSWKRKVDDGGRRLSYLELAEELVAYAKDMGFTHLELLPVSEFPFDGSWGYQPVGLYAPTIRFGTPNEFRALVEAAHAAGLGVILDWVPGHFPTDDHGLYQFDGTHLYDHADPKEGFHQDWNTAIYNYGRNEVRGHLIANALYWLSEYHVDGLRVDAVASMLYRDYSRDDGEWVPNQDGGRENYEAIEFLKDLNKAVYRECPGIMTVAEESTSFPGVSKPVDHGGLGFGFKWNMGWMNDTLRYIEKDPVHRSHDHHLITFPIDWSFSENFVLPISHDEVVHGKGSMIAKMPGNDWEKFANLRAYYGYMWGHPGKKLLFMGCEFAQVAEWNHDQSLDWHLLDHQPHQGVQNLVRDLNSIYRDTPALYAKDCDADGFRWIANDPAQSVTVFARMAEDDVVIVVCNFTPVERASYRIGVPVAGLWKEILNTDSSHYGGGDRGNYGEVRSEAQGWDGFENSVAVTLPPLSTLMFRLRG